MPAPSYRLIAVDLDGTLLDRSGQPHARDVAALRRAAERGIQVSIVTGRLYSGTRASAEAIGIRGPIVCAEGSHVVRGADHSTLVHHGIPAPAAAALRLALERQRLAATFLFAEDTIVHDAAGAPHFTYVKTWSNEARPTHDVLAHPLWERPAALTGVVSVGTREQVEQIHAELSRLDAAVQVATFTLWHDAGKWGTFIRAAGITKGSGLELVAQHHGVALEETVTVGDWLNDVAMFRVSGRSYAMGHAPEQVKGAATRVLPESSAEGGGIARAVAESFGID